MAVDAEQKKRAKKLGIEITPEMKDGDLDTLIADAEKKIAQEKEELEIKKADEKRAATEAKKTKIVLQNTFGEEVDQADYFFPDTEKGITETAPTYFNKVCGYPVDREDLLEVFNEIFSSKKGFLFYRSRDKELYHILVPLKYATTISRSNESRPGDIQKHALSFLNEGSVNVDSLKLKLKRVAAHNSIAEK